MTGPPLPRHMAHMAAVSRLREAPTASRLPHSLLDPTVGRQLLIMAQNPRGRLGCMESQRRRRLVDPTVDHRPKAVDRMVGREYPTVPHPLVRLTNPPPAVFQ